MVDKNKFLIIGLGSMGKRRIRNLTNLGYTNLIGFDKRADRISEVNEDYQIKTISNLNEIDISEFKAMFVSVPPDIHMEYANKAFDNKINCFIEASVVDDGIFDLSKKVEKTNLKFYASSTLRFHPTIKKIKKIIDNNELGKLSNFSYHTGQYLPDWHPWENIKDFYVSRKETGGCREIVPFELGWLNWVFGDIRRLFGFNEKTINLNSDIDDVYSSVLQYESGVLGTFLVDVVSRNAIRSLIVNGENGQLIWNYDERVLKHFNAIEQRWIYYYEPDGQAAENYNKNIIEEMYIDEVETFINSIDKNIPVMNSLSSDLKTLNYLYDIEKSNN